MPVTYYPFASCCVLCRSVLMPVTKCLFASCCFLCRSVHTLCYIMCTLVFAPDCWLCRFVFALFRLLAMQACASR
jgi:hypothetical protein